MRRILLALAVLPGPALADIAQPRSLAVVEEGVVRLGDLFDGLGPRGATVLGPAPAPGQRQVVEAPQLAAIARSYGVAWRPIVGGERVVIERPGRPVERAEVLELLREALATRGLDTDSELDLQGFTPPLVPSSAFLQMAIEQAGLDSTGTRFAATLALAAEDMPTQRIRLTGRVVRMVEQVVAARRLPAGEVLGRSDVRVLRVPASSFRPGAVQRAELALGQVLRRPAMMEQPILAADLAAPVAIEKGANVTMVYEAPGIALTAQGRAMESAGRGGTLPVMNLGSRIVVEAQAIGPGRVRVLSGGLR